MTYEKLNMKLNSYFCRVTFLDWTHVCFKILMEFA